jgi:lysophospholipase L1-like esterase
MAHDDDSGFKDVPSDSWFYDAVLTMASLNAVDGFSDGLFKPDEPVTVAQFLKMLCAAVIPDRAEPALALSDPNDWSEFFYYAALDYALIRESEFTLDQLDLPLSRYDAALLISRASEKILQESAPLRSDVNAIIADSGELPAKYVHAVQLCYSKGISGGFEDGSFNGEKPLTRAQGVVMVMRLTLPEVRNLPSPEPSPATRGAVTTSASIIATVPPAASGSPVLPTPSNSPVKDAAAFVAEETVIIGDSLTHGLYLYGKMREPTYLFSTGMSTSNALSKSFETNSGKKLKLIDALSGEDYKAVYILLGINELGSDVEAYSTRYGKLIDKIKETLPDATIYIESVLPVSKKKSNSGGSFTKANVLKFNDALMKLAEDKEVEYLDVYAIFADEDGYLPPDSTWDGVHLNTKYYAVWAKHLSS